jgi:mannose-1-phosphate guanylyltransferase
MALDPQEIVLVTPSDHLIKDEDEYTKVVEQAKQLASQDNLVTFGITPAYPETGFGYIEAEASSVKSGGLSVKSFHEKPNLEVAEEYLKENLTLSTQHLALKFLWNSGMFMFKAGVFLEELKTHSLEIFETCQEAHKTKVIQNSTLRIQHSQMEAIPSESIDYAVMEKSQKVKVVPSSIDWSDLGSFESLDEEIEASDNIISIDSSNNLILSDKTVATIDINDLIIVDTDDALLISKKGSSQKVKQVVKQLNIQNSKLTIEHSVVHRPWGTYEVLLSTANYKIKRIVVKPGKRLSLQKHFHRNEHWIVVSGTATVTVGDSIKLIRPNESTYIKMGEVHRLENQGKIPVVLIEAQVGEYTGEDDIVRIDDDFNRN